MLAKVCTYIAWGIDALPVEVEVDVSSGFPSFSLVGMADTSIKESKERVKAAIKNSGFIWPTERITVSLIPADLKKEGTIFDMPIALGILAASSQLSPELLLGFCVLGGLSLDGSLRQAHGTLPICLAMAQDKVCKVILPRQNVQEAGLVKGIEAFPVENLVETVSFLRDQLLIKPWVSADPQTQGTAQEYPFDFSEVKGQEAAKRALEVAIAGGHNVLMIGPPGSGKSMLAKRLPSIMPFLTMEESLELTRIYSACRKTGGANGLIRSRPFRAPHHRTSSSALIGGGPGSQPGEISLAHHGILFLDELPEFPRDCLEGLRQPMEDGYACVSRTSRTVTYPSSFTLVAAMNPCPCGYYTDQHRRCRCNPNKIAAYMSRISGPLLDRIDIHLELSSVRYNDLSDSRSAEPSSGIRQRVETSRRVQRERFNGLGIFCNAQMNSRLVGEHCRLEDKAAGLLRMVMVESGLSARAYDKILRVSRTIADLAGAREIGEEHIAEAARYRTLDRQ